MAPQIKTYDDPMLKQKCIPVKDGEDVTQLIEDMRTALKKSKDGVGLAAPQIGVTKRVILIRKSPMINPTILWYSPMKKIEEEGCLSYPGFYAPIERHVSIKIEYFGVDKKKVTANLHDFDARIAQHEIDHLDGVCLVGDEYYKSLDTSGRNNI